MTLGSAFRKALFALGLSSMPLQPVAANALDAQPTAALRVDVRAQPPALTGIASYYGTPKDRFGHVDRNDPLVRHLLVKNGVPVDRLPVRFLAAQFLKPSQIAALHKSNPNKYRLITASGRVLDPRELIAAMDKQYVGKHAEVTNLANGKRLVVTITDSGSFPEKYGRLIDVSTAVAEKLGFSAGGLAQVQVRVLD